MKPPHLNVSEWFGPTVQGEGPHAGALASFLRLAGCNLTCSWCDSRYTWDWKTYDRSEQSHQIPVAEVGEILAALPGRIVVTGGEPLLQASALAVLLSRAAHLRPFDVETNGTRPLGATAQFWDTITCSPKVGVSAGQGLLGRSLAPSVLADRRTIFKFVVAGPEDLADVDAFVAEHELPHRRVWLMPEGVDPASLTALLPGVAEAAVTRGMNVTTRLHVYAWPSETRGH